MASNELDLAALSKLEPKVPALLARARKERRRTWAARLLLYRRLLPELERVVGWSRADGDPILATRMAYKVADDALTRALGI